MARRSGFSASTRTAILALVIATLTTAAWAGPKYKVLHAFGMGDDGGGLWGSLVFDSKGNLYGETSGGGGYGTVFQLTPHRDGHWSETILHSFYNGDPDGDNLNGSPVLDDEGNVYAAATSGGLGSGTVFKLTPGSHGWKLTVLHRFNQKVPAGSPQGPLIMDQVGNLYGTAGNPFDLSHGSDGWRAIVLHDFTCRNGDGCDPYGLVMDASRNLYGITTMGGTSRQCGGGCGTAYELHPTLDGKWKETILHDFDTNNDNMAFPGGVLTLDSAGSLYGIAGGGAYSDGVVYRLTRSPGGRWIGSILHSFTGGTNGDNPSGGVFMDKSGNLYGVTVYGGDPNCDCGVIYKLSPGANGPWKYSVQHRFTGYDGAQPVAQLILDAQGNLYGTTATGGAGGAGVAFELTP